MKKTLFITVILCTVLSSAQVSQASLILLNFSKTGATTANTLTTISSKYGDIDAATWNSYCAGAKTNEFTGAELNNSTGISSGIIFSHNSSVFESTGAGGVINNITESSPVFGLVDATIYGELAAVGKGSSTTLSFTGLGANTAYEMSFFAGRGNNLGTNSDGIWTLGGGITIDSAEVATNTTRSTPTPSFSEDKTTLTANWNGAENATTNDFLVTYRFTTDESGILSLTMANDATDNSQYNAGINFLTLKTIPEPSTASLGLLSLAGLMLRRRR